MPCIPHMLSICKVGSLLCTGDSLQSPQMDLCWWPLRQPCPRTPVFAAQYCVTRTGACPAQVSNITTAAANLRAQAFKGIHAVCEAFASQDHAGFIPSLSLKLLSSLLSSLQQQEPLIEPKFLRVEWLLVSGPKRHLWVGSVAAFVIQPREEEERQGRHKAAPIYTLPSAQRAAAIHLTLFPREHPGTGCTECG